MRRPNSTYAVTSLVLILLCVNPLIETMEGKSAILFMFSHYALFFAGFILSYRSLRWNWYTLIAGVSLAAFWHFPVPFALSGAFLLYRIMEEGSMVAAGFLVGAAVEPLPSVTRPVLFGLWIAADSALSVVFIIHPSLYSSGDISYSPFSAAQFVLLGVLMIFFMNSVIGVFVYVYAKRYRALISAE